jgi:16S rRNA processing protein RimM
MAPNVTGQNSAVTDTLVQVGEIIKPHGIRGEVKIYSYSEEPENFVHYKKVVLQASPGSGTKTYNIVKSRKQGKLAIMQLEGIVSREEAENLQGSTVWVKKTDFPQLDAGEYYWHQLIGLQVHTDTGSDLGKVAGLFSTGAYDVLVVTGGDREYLIPVQDEIISAVDEKNGELFIAPFPGMLEANEHEEE